MLKKIWKKLEQGSQIVVGTPGRVSDMISRKAFNPKYIKLFVLDEADEMLSRGFKEQIHEVFTKMPYTIQVILLSATMPTEVLDVTKKFMRDPIRILVKKKKNLLWKVLNNSTSWLEEKIGNWKHFAIFIKLSQ